MTIDGVKKIISAGVINKRIEAGLCDKLERPTALLEALKSESSIELSEEEMNALLDDIPSVKNIKEFTREVIERGIVPGKERL